MYSNEGQRRRRPPTTEASAPPTARGGRGGSYQTGQTAVPGGTSTHYPTPVAQAPSVSGVYDSSGRPRIAAIPGGVGGAPQAQAAHKQAAALVHQMQQLIAQLSSQLPSSPIVGTNLQFQQFLPDLLRAAKENNVPPSILLAQINTESGFGQVPNTFSGSSAGAKGVTQFMPATAAEYGVDLSPTAAGIKSQIEGQAKLMGNNIKQYGMVGALKAYNSGRPTAEAPGYSAGILSDAQNYAAADKAAKVTPGAIGAPAMQKGVYVNPFKHSDTAVQTRTDAGADYYGTGPIGAIGKEKILSISSGFGGQYGTQGVLAKLLKGPRAGKNTYIYEGIQPTVQPGDIVGPGQEVGQFTGGIETGWANEAGQPIAFAKGTALPDNSVQGGHYSPQGYNFVNFMSKLGGAQAPPGTRGSVSPTDPGLDPHVDVAGRGQPRTVMGVPVSAGASAAGGALRSYTTPSGAPGVSTAATVPGVPTPGAPMATTPDTGKKAAAGALGNLNPYEDPNVKLDSALISLGGNAPPAVQEGYQQMYQYALLDAARKMLKATRVR